MEGTNSKNFFQILLVEDSPSDAALLQENILLSGVKDTCVSVAQSLHEAVDYLKNNHVDAVLLDLTLPDSSGLDTVREISRTAPDLPVVVLTGIDDENMGIEAVRMGIQDYLVKGRADGRTITRAVRYAMERKRAEQELRRAHDQWERTFEAVPDLICILDQAHRIVRVNKAVADRLACEPKDLVGRHCYEVDRKSVV